RENADGQLSAYVAKKDLEEDVVEQKVSEEGKIFVLANGWELLFPTLEDPLNLPLTAEAKRL
ncbi:MAG: putative nitrogen fixation protein NifT, partial [Cyanobacteriota bacterium]|nr:putative nitrogen fixation protein NifT [Cyanobacteriota bacterium]